MSEQQHHIDNGPRPPVDDVEAETYLAINEKYAKRIEAGLFAQHLLTKPADERHGYTDQELEWLSQDSYIAKEEMVVANLGLVNDGLSRYGHRLSPAFDRDDLRSEGRYGLTKAVERYDYTKGAFSNHALVWINKEINKALLNTSRVVRLPQKKYAALTKLDRQKEILIQTLGREPSTAELAQETGMGHELVALLQNAGKRTASLQSLIGMYDDDELAILIPDDSLGVQDEVQINALAQEASETIDIILTPREGDVLHRLTGLHDGSTWSKTDIATHHGISRRRVGQIAEGALTKLKEALRDISPDEAESPRIYAVPEFYDDVDDYEPVPNERERRVLARYVFSEYAQRLTPRELRPYRAAILGIPIDDLATRYHEAAVTGDVHQLYEPHNPNLSTESA